MVTQNKQDTYLLIYVVAIFVLVSAGLFIFGASSYEINIFKFTLYGVIALFIVLLQLRFQYQIIHNPEQSPFIPRQFANPWTFVFIFLGIFLLLAAFWTTVCPW